MKVRDPKGRFEALITLPPWPPSHSPRPPRANPGDATRTAGTTAMAVPAYSGATADRWRNRRRRRSSPCRVVGGDGPGARTRLEFRWSAIPRRPAVLGTMSRGVGCGGAGAAAAWRDPRPGKLTVGWIAAVPEPGFGRTDRRPTPALQFTLWDLSPREQTDLIERSGDEHQRGHAWGLLKRAGGFPYHRGRRLSGLLPCRALGATHLAENPAQRPHLPWRAGAQRLRGLDSAPFGATSLAEARCGSVYPFTNPLDEGAGRR